MIWLTMLLCILKTQFQRACNLLREVASIGAEAIANAVMDSPSFKSIQSSFERAIVNASTPSASRQSQPTIGTARQPGSRMHVRVSTGSFSAASAASVGSTSTELGGRRKRYSAVQALLIGEFEAAAFTMTENSEMVKLGNFIRESGFIQTYDKRFIPFREMRCLVQGDTHD